MGSIVEQQADRIDELETELTDYRAPNGCDKAEIRRKITEGENQQTDTPSENAIPEGVARTSSLQAADYT